MRNAIVSISVINSFPKRVKLMDFDIAQFWKHSLAVAVTSKNIAQLSKKESPENCFVGGLLHDVGPELRLDLSTMHPHVVKFMMNMMEDVGDWYSGLTDEIEAAYTLFLELDL